MLMEDASAAINGSRQAGHRGKLLRRGWKIRDVSVSLTFKSMIGPHRNPVMVPTSIRSHTNISWKDNPVTSIIHRFSLEEAISPFTTARLTHRQFGNSPGKIRLPIAGSSQPSEVEYRSLSLPA